MMSFIGRVLNRGSTVLSHSNKQDCLSIVHTANDTMHNTLMSLRDT